LSSVNTNFVSNQNISSPLSAPSSAVSNQQSRPARPPVPLFSQSTGSVPQTAKMMNAAGQYLEAPICSEAPGSQIPTDVDLDDFTFIEGGASTAFSSPAVPMVFDFNGSMSSSSNLGTVSPHDLFLQEPFMSAPNSSALTALTSPSIYNESPDFDAFNTSPNFGSSDFDGPADKWYPLFPQETAPAVAAPQASVENSPLQKSDDMDALVMERSSSGESRRKSTNSPPSSGGRHASVSGVGARKRDKPLPDIIVEDPTDIVAMKRARNTLAARKSRQRKAVRFEELEERIAKLEEERDHWKKIALAQSGGN
jgi:hypothetical protein